MISEKDVAKGRVLISACAIIEVEGEVLMMYEGDLPYHNWWVLPGGYVKPDETIEQTVAREIEEETGLKIASTRLIGIYQDFLTHKGEPINYIIIAYEAKVVGGRIIFSKEATAYKWISIQEALESSEIPSVFKTILKDFGKQKSTKWFQRRKKLL
ncbi:MAG: NUDIX domain-containing protein [Candidatus Bathyarchaeota archaeon]|nr:NUDIX domain-containing protein [Candidatus Bathyarchaeota archaeon]